MQTTPDGVVAEDLLETLTAATGADMRIAEGGLSGISALWTESQNQVREEEGWHVYVCVCVCVCVCVLS